MRLSDYLHILDGELIKDTDFRTLDYCISECQEPYLTFIENEKYINKMNQNACAVFTTREIAEKLPVNIMGVFICEEPKWQFVMLHNHLNRTGGYRPDCVATKIGENCNISPLADIASENVIIGDNVYIGANVVVREGTVIGDNVIICENCVIGGKSFNYVKGSGGKMLGIEDAGGVELCRGVEICSNCHVACGTMPQDVTVLEQDVKLDAFIHVGHGTKIGERTLITAGVKIAGNVRIGQDVWLGVNSTISNRIIIGDNARVSLGAVVTKNVECNQTVTGNFAINHEKYLEHLKNIR